MKNRQGGLAVLTGLLLLTAACGRPASPKDALRSDGTPDAQDPTPAASVTPAVGASATVNTTIASDSPAAGALPLGEYGCIGSGTTQLAGMGSKLLAGGRYTDLDGTTSGTYTISGSTITFIGGHLDGETGRDIKNNGYTIGRMVSCQKW